MENIKEEIRKKIQCFSKVAWSNQDIMLALDIGETKASQLHQLAKRIMIALDIVETKASQLHQLAKRNRGIIRALKTKVKSEVVCLLVGIDAKEEVKRLVNILKEIEEEEEHGKIEH